MTATRWYSIDETVQGLRPLHESGKSIGTVHTLGALHDGHSKLISLAAQENDIVIVTIYPNITQLPAGSTYIYDVEKDCHFAVQYGATHLITPSTMEIYPEEYSTFLDQGEQYQRLDGELSPWLFRGMITMTLRWLIITRPTRSYFGLKDIAQAILVKRAVKDFWMDIIIREVPCVRYRSGMAISSRMMNKPRSVVVEFNRAYHALEAGRKLMASGVTNTSELIDEMHRIIDKPSLRHFTLQYIKVAKPFNFIEPMVADLPIILQIVMSWENRNWFEGFFLRNETELQNGPEVIWLEQTYPEFIDTSVS